MIALPLLHPLSSCPILLLRLAFGSEPSGPNGETLFVPL
jgi:hypothetical protein